MKTYPTQWKGSTKQLDKLTKVWNNSEMRRQATLQPHETTTSLPPVTTQIGWMWTGSASNGSLLKKENDTSKKDDASPVDRRDTSLMNALRNQPEVHLITTRNKEASSIGTIILLLATTTKERTLGRRKRLK